MMMTVAVTGLSIGRISLTKIVKRFAPSIMPASSTDTGIERMNAVYRNTDNGMLMAASTRTMPQ